MQWVRHVHRIPVPAPYATGELSVAEVAHRLGVSSDVVYYWIKAGQLTARRGGNRLCVPWTTDVEADCRQRISKSSHLTTATQTVTAGAAV